MATLASRVAQVVADGADRIAIADGERRCSYGQFWAQARTLAAQLRSAGLTPGDRVAIVLPNRIEAATAVYGTWLAGGVAVPLNAQARARDFAPWLRHCDARVIVHEHDNVDVAKALQALDAPPHAIALEADSGFVDRLGDSHGVRTPDDPAAVALILYTSGTTGAPKGVTLSHGNLLANAEAVVGYLGLGPDDSVLDVLPFYYAYGASVLHTHLMCGARVVLAPSMLFPHLVVDALRRERVTGFSAVPSTFALLLDRGHLDALKAPALRYLTQAGGAMSPALTRRVRDALPGPRLFVMYGQTEATSRLTYLSPERLDDKPGSVGRALTGVEIAVLREDGRPASIDEEGEVCARGPNVMLGYWHSPDATAAALRDGWLHTGDLGRLDADGDLFLAGRRSDMIKTGAHRVNPADVEEAIAELPWVIEAAVVGIDDAVLGQVIMACVVVSDLPDRADDRIRAHCRAQLAPYKVPKFVQFIDALPRTASGKVRRIQLTETQLP
ncbi:class I adenylate-forming enzyme family protein [Cognatilysobacter tabacisoli]|uniref:class I adenylate-forming enzyme family protein n=1 Tax=Cognatilysobacter tabacisoli TaxID=2315424 RepID=UPI000E6AFFA2|nr:class I adenylate-forming enzyme family protein [Lysobacter tabacisoli]